MPENIRAYIVIVVLSTVAFFVLSRWNPLPENQKLYRPWAGYWIAVTSAAFVGHNYWLFIFVVASLLLIIVPRSSNIRLPLYFLLLPALPLLYNEIPGFGGIRYFFTLTYPRLLALCVLLPLYISTYRQNRNVNGKQYFPSDKYLFMFAGLSVLLAFRESTLTNSLRSGFYVFLDIVIPYYVISRNVRSLNDFKSIFQAIFTSAFILSVLALFESIKGWLLYRSLYGALDIPGLKRGYGTREGFLRVGTTMSTIPFGYILTIGFGAFNFFKPYFAGFRYVAISGVIIVALLATVSRGPWVGFAAMVVVFAIFSPRRMKSLALLTVGLVVGIPVLNLLPGGEKFLSLLPFIGGGSHDVTVTYRQNLLEKGIEVIYQNPWFGSATFRQTSEMEAMRQGQHIIDVVNTYLAVALKKGLLGLGLFVGFFANLLLEIRKAMVLARALGDEYAWLGLTLLAILVAILVIIATVSSAEYIPIYYWAIGGLGAAYVNLIRMELTKKASQPS